MLFNKDMVSDLNLDESLYDMVRDNKWTLDGYASIAKNFVKDLNGDGSLTPEDDLLGYIAQLTVNRSLQEGFGLSLFTDDKTGTFHSQA